MGLQLFILLKERSATGLAPRLHTLLPDCQANFTFNAHLLCLTSGTPRRIADALPCRSLASMHGECLPLQLRHARLAVQRLTAQEHVSGKHVELRSCVLVMHACLSAGLRMSMPAFGRL